MIKSNIAIVKLILNHTRIRRKIRQIVVRSINKIEGLIYPKHGILRVIFKIQLQGCRGVWNGAVLEWIRQIVSPEICITH